MDYSSFYETLVRRLYVESGVEQSNAALRFRERLPRIPVTIIDDPSEIPESERTGSTIYLHGQRGAPVTRCPGTKEHLCCNYLTIELYSGCPIGCTYCIMRSYLNFAPVSVVAKTDGIIADIIRIARANPGTMIRVGSGETGDSLLYDPLFDLSREIIEGVSGEPNVYFEVKTKTALVDHLLGVGHTGNAVVGFSLAPQEIVDAEEGSAASLSDRLAAAERAVDAGYLVSFHFDPMFYRDDWRDRYLPVVDLLRRFAVTEGSSSRVAWISLGTFRFPPELKERMARRPYLYDEFVRSADGKYRYVQRLRREMYREMRERLTSMIAAPVYLCMESSTVWEKSTGALPEDLDLESPLFLRPDL